MATSRQQLRKYLDWPLVGAALGLVVCGIVGLLSATTGTATARVSGLAGIQFLWLVLGIGVAIGAIRVPTRFWFGISYILYGISIIALVLTLAVGVSRMGAERWLAIGPFRFQTSEMGKIGLILALARYLSFHKVSVSRFRDFAVTVGLVLVPIALIHRQPDLGTALVYGSIFLPMVYWAGLANLHLLAIITPVINAVCAFAGWIPWLVFLLILVGVLFLMRPPLRWTVVIAVINLVVGIVTPAIWDRLEPFQQRRIETFFSPEKDPLGAGYQIIQSQVAIGSGGLWGKGFLEGSQTRLAYLPETHTDFIFAVLGEEFGFLGAIVIVALYVLLIWRIFRMALVANNNFASFVCIGVGSMFAFHGIINIGMTIGLAPVTGLPLLLVSYGGSSLLTNGLAIGMVLGFGVRRFE
ncbi:MAG TPA: rod shape-determining protein RodA [Candidatus Latescibacteria bacterium]|nr:rod shape-determining protein RodA [Candidatus Latescibacterota bacterium]HOS64305.1 rod shape-determining protein RodA [Candidatus Latescibacterota bacterium]HPK74370.1 rod shape-determining protein RodA [Candidatus Latescibacterota bacterium]